jgi:hypothetical protein
MRTSGSCAAIWRTSVPWGSAGGRCSMLKPRIRRGSVLARPVARCVTCRQRNYKLVPCRHTDPPHVRPHRCTLVRNKSAEATGQHSGADQARQCDPWCALVQRGVEVGVVPKRKAIEVTVRMLQSLGQYTRIVHATSIRPGSLAPPIVRRCQAKEPIVRADLLPVSLNVAR